MQIRGRNGFKTCECLEKFPGRPFLQKGPPRTPPQKLSLFCTIIADGDNGVVFETPACLSL